MITHFRRAQLLVLLSTLPEAQTIDRIGYLEFFAANPHLVVRGGQDSVRLELAGFNPDALNYQSAPERYANRRSRLRSDLAALTAWGYALPLVVDGRIACFITPLGLEKADGLTSMYADAYRNSIRMIRHLFGLSETALAKRAREWLNINDIRFDLLDIAPSESFVIEPTN